MPSSEIESFIQAYRANPVPGNLSLAQQREYLDAVFGAVPLADDTRIDTVEIGHLTCDWVRRPEARDDRVILYLHGGGYVLGSSKMYREFGCRLSAATQAAVLLVNYRLAPENPFPCALEDAIFAYRWLLSTSSDGTQVILAGDSAGGGLAIATLTCLQGLSLKPPAAAVCISPWVDLALSGATVAPGVVDDPLLSATALAEMARSYAAGKLDQSLVSPINANLSGLPPLCLLVGTREILLDDSRRLNARARGAGVDTDYFEGEGLVHCWPVLIGTAPESRHALARIGRFVEQQLNR